MFFLAEDVFQRTEDPRLISPFCQRWYNARNAFYRMPRRITTRKNKSLLSRLTTIALLEMSGLVIWLLVILLTALLEPISPALKTIAVPTEMHAAGFLFALLLGVLLITLLKGRSSFGTISSVILSFF